MTLGVTWRTENKSVLGKNNVNAAANNVNAAANNVNAAANNVNAAANNVNAAANIADLSAFFTKRELVARLNAPPQGVQARRERLK